MTVRERNPAGLPARGDSRRCAPAPVVRALRRGLVLAVVTAAAAAPIRAEELVRLLAPSPGVALVAGARVTVEWAPGPALATFPRADEWEVFLSLDGGRSYLSRLTPHLDLDVRRVTIRLPDVATADARLMVRVGDERVEREQELPGRYRIVPAAVPPATAFPRRVAARGEPARAQAPGVLSWVEGGRDGSRWVQREGGAPPARVTAVARAGAVLLLAAGPGGRCAALAGRAAPAREAPVRSPSLPAPALGAVVASPSLAILCRRNE